MLSIFHPTGAGDGLQAVGHLVDLLFDLEALLLGLLVVVPHYFEHLQEGVSDVKVPAGAKY